MSIEPGGKAAAWIVVGLAACLAAGMTVALTRAPVRVAQCGPGFLSSGAHCVVPAERCPAPLVATDLGCDAPLGASVRIAVPAVTAELGPSDWEAEGRVASRIVRTGPFAIDAFEATAGQVFCEACPLPDPGRLAGPPSRAAAGLSLAEARTVCRARGGRLPTDDEWTALSAVVDAGSSSGGGSVLHRYPWGDTGAVCRRAAFGLSRGPCATGAKEADPVGAHPDGDSAAGVHDLAGNVAEWTEDGFVRGGSWDSALAEELRTWARAEVPPLAHDPRIGVRCAYEQR
jgi:formylglycine-generating enzyme required for sulfatase activity